MINDGLCFIRTLNTQQVNAKSFESKCLIFNFIGNVLPV